MRALTARLARCALTLGLLLAAATGCGSPPGPSRVTVMVPWSGTEFQAFYAVAKRFEKDTGIHVDVQVTRALTQQLDAAVAAGEPPDLAVLPSVGAIHGYAEEEHLRPIDVGMGAYTQPFRSLATWNGTTYAVPVKVDVKSLIWFDPRVTGKPPSTTPTDLVSLSRHTARRTWCLGLASGPTSGWPGADWIADLMLGESGGTGTAHPTADAYRQWLSGHLHWSDAPVKDAWTTWREIVGDSIKGAATQQFGEATEGMTDRPPTCSFDHGGISAMGFGRTLSAGHDYDFVTYSSARPLQVSADFVGMFTDDPAARALIAYLSSDRAQRAWVNERGGYALSADSRVRPDSYDNVVQRRIAALLQPQSPYTLCFSAADVMSPDESAAFYRAVLDYATGAEELPTLLRELDDVQKSSGGSPVVQDDLCARP